MGVLPLAESEPEDHVQTTGKVWEVVKIAGAKLMAEEV